LISLPPRGTTSRCSMRKRDGSIFTLRYRSFFREGATSEPTVAGAESKPRVGSLNDENLCSSELFRRTHAHTCVSLPNTLVFLLFIARILACVSVILFCSSFRCTTLERVQACKAPARTIDTGGTHTTYSPEDEPNLVAPLTQRQPLQSGHQHQVAATTHPPPGVLVACTRSWSWATLYLAKVQTTGFPS